MLLYVIICYNMLLYVIICYYMLLYVIICQVFYTNLKTNTKNTKLCNKNKL